MVGGLTGAAAVVGLLLGYGSAMGLFYYDGTQPVNVVRILGVYVGLNALTLLLLGWAALPGGFGGGWLRRISPGRWVAAAAGWVASRMGPDGRGSEMVQAVRAVLGRAGAHQTLYGRVQKWQVLNWSQTAALTFNLGALAGALSLIVLSDLAFGWSTTLDIEPGVMHGITGWLSWPWGWAWRESVPTRQLVEVTQTYRAQWIDRDTAPALAARWWPFVVTCIVVYGVLPRVLTWSVSRWRLREAVQRATAWTPGVDRLCSRMGSAVVSTRSVDREAPGSGDIVQPLLQTEPMGDSACVIRWASAPLPAGMEVRQITDAGGAELADDRAAIAAAVAAVKGAGDAGHSEGELGNRTNHEERSVRVVVRAWEPPVLELLDFLEDLRVELGQGTVIEVQPVGAGDREVWRKRLTATGDPWLRWVEGGAGSSESGMMIKANSQTKSAEQATRGAGLDQADDLQISAEGVERE